MIAKHDCVRRGENGHVAGPALVIAAANDSEAIMQAESLHGSFAAKLLDLDGLRVVRRLPPNGKELQPPRIG